MSCSVLLLFPWRADVKPKPQIVIWLSSLLLLSALFIPSIIILSRMKPEENNSQKAKMPASSTRWGAVHRFVLLSLQEEETLNPSSKCTMNGWWSHMDQTSKKHFVLECLLISLGFTLLHFCLCHMWPVNMNWTAAYASATSFWDTQTLGKICTYSYFPRHCGSWTYTFLTD